MLLDGEAYHKAKAAFDAAHTPLGAARQKFEAVTHTVAHGVPVLDGALAWLACDLVDLREAGDHTIGVGAVTQMEADAQGEPLVFFRGAYMTLGG